MVTKIAYQRISPNRFDRAVWDVSLIVFTPAGGIADVDPSGGLVAGSLEPLAIDEGFGEINRMMVYRIPMIGQHPAHLPQNMRCQVLDANPGENEESAIIHDEMKILSSHMGRPADKPVPAADMAGSRRPGQTGNRL